MFNLEGLREELMGAVKDVEHAQRKQTFGLGVLPELHSISMSLAVMLESIAAEETWTVAEVLEREG